MALALGLLQGERLGDFRRIRGECWCSDTVGCQVMPRGSEIDICFSADGRDGSRTVVVLYITAAGLCLEGPSRDICLSNSSCGAQGVCDVKAVSWMRAYAELQNRNEATLRV